MDPDRSHLILLRFDDGDRNRRETPWWKPRVDGNSRVIASVDCPLSWNPIHVNYKNQRGVGWTTEMLFKLKRDVSNHLGLKPHF
ncbi:unnamed protein product, partial [Mesorhabditis spiculigera]